MSLRSTSGPSSPNNIPPRPPMPDFADMLWGWAREGGDYPSSSTKPDAVFRTMECWMYEDVPPVTKHENKDLVIGAIGHWLETPYPLHGEQPPSAGYKILLIDSNDLPLSKKDSKHINTLFGLPPVENHFTSMNSGASGMFTKSDGSFVFVLRKTGDYASISTILRYDPQTNITCGVFHIDAKNINYDDFIKLPTQFIQCTHPLILPLLAVELTVEVKISQLFKNVTHLLEIESETGFSYYKSDKASGRKTDYQALVRKLGGCQSQLQLILATLTIVQYSVAFIREKVRLLNQVLDDERRQKLEAPTKMIEERIEYVLSNLKNAMVDGGWEKRMQAQQAVLFNLIAQSDNKINISLAKDSKEIATASRQDSSAMKIIAVLTTFFLPGTFIATFFAMPLFDWSEPSISSIANDHFWIYWAVTGPLTLVTMSGVIVWALWNSRRARSLQRRARESVGAGGVQDGPGWETSQ